MAELSTGEPISAETVFALPPPLRAVVLELLAERGSAYLRYSHLRHALSLAGPCDSVLLLAAGRGFGGLALALEHPGTSFTLSELPVRNDRLEAARRLAEALGLANVRFETIDPLEPGPAPGSFDFVASNDLLLAYPDAVAIADAHLRLSRRFVFALVPFAPATDTRPALERARRGRGAGESTNGFDPFELMALFPGALAVRGWLWADAGQVHRARLKEATLEAIDDDPHRFLVLAEADRRPGFPRAARDAGGVWVLADGGLARPERRTSPEPADGGHDERSGGSGAIVRDGVPFEPGRLLTVSGMLDPAYYRARYPDILNKDADPLDHYLRRGAAEGRWPNATFDSKAYARAARIDPTKVNAAVHHLTTTAVRYTRYVAPEPRIRADLAAPPADSRPVGSRRATAIDTKASPDVTGRAITIVMPIRDGGDSVRHAIEAVRAETRLPDVELLLVDDASTDEALVRDLDRYARLDGVSLLRNETSRGFTACVVRGLAHAARGKRDVLILGSDTRVGPGFLEVLVRAAYSAPDIATASALSDSAGAFSTPPPGVGETKLGVPLERVARLSRFAAPSLTWPVPMGNGCCTYVRASALEEVGTFDSERFPHGPGAEDDFCMRAADHGLRHVVALGAYVLHRDAGDEMHARTLEARASLDELHPDFGPRVRAAFDGPNPLTRQRSTLARSLEAAPRAAEWDPARPRALYVISTKTGGTPQTNQDLMRGVSHLYRPLLLSCDARTLTLVDASTTPHTFLAEHRLREPIGMLPHTSDEYDQVVATWMEGFHVELLHVRHIAWHGLGLTRVARRLGIPIVVSLHDFYSVCPSVNLTDGRAPWSPTGYANPTIVAPLWEQKDPASFARAAAMPPTAFLNLWQRRMDTMLEAADRYVTTSRTAMEVLSGSLPVLRHRAGAFHVIPHGRDFEQMAIASTAPTADEPLRVLLPGNITESKGLATVLRMLELDAEGTIELHTLGNVRASLQGHPRVRNHGTYDREDFVPLVRAIRPHVSLIASIWPETFCHTLTESWAAGIPVIGSRLGAVGERLESEGGGFIVDPHDAEGILALCRRLRADATEWRAAMRDVETWQRGLGERETVAAMTKQYLGLYRELFRDRRRFGGRIDREPLGLAKRVALVAAGPLAPSALALSRDELDGLGIEGPVDLTWVDAAAVARTAACEFDAVVVRAGAADPNVLEAVRDACAGEGVRLHVAARR